MSESGPTPAGSARWTRTPHPMGNSLDQALGRFAKSDHTRQLSALKCRLTSPRSAAEPKPEPRRAPLSERSECVSGHPITGPESIYVDGKGAQRCAQCRREQRREYARRHCERRKATAPPRFCFEPGCPNTLTALAPGRDPLPLVRRGGATAPGSIKDGRRGGRARQRAEGHTA